MKLLLIKPMFPFYLKPKSRPHFPMGIGFLASYLISFGIEIEILDILGERLDYWQARERLQKGKWDAIGISAISVQYIYVKNLCRLIKELHPTTKIIVGGVLPTHNYKEILNNTATDFCVIGQGWEPIKNLLISSFNPKGIAGIAYRRDEKIDLTPPVHLPREVDYPRPAYELFNMDIYFGTNLPYYNPNEKTANIITGFGCPYQCGFCSKLNKSYYNHRKISGIIKEVNFLREKYGVKEIHLLDECLFIVKEHLEEFCREIKKTGLSWTAQGRANLVTPEILTMIKEAGCKSIGYGIETGSERLLKLMRKAQTVEQIENAVRWTAKAGVKIKVQLMMGYPGEDAQTAQETVDLFDRLAYPPRRFLILCPLPGSEVYENLVREGRIKNEAEYLEKISSGLSGVRPKKLIMNCTQMSDKELFKLVKKTEKKMEKNYRNHLKKGDALGYVKPPKIKMTPLAAASKIFIAIKSILKLLGVKKILKILGVKKSRFNKTKINLQARKNYYFWDHPDPAAAPGFKDEF